jgi:hypothetical protein
MTRRGSGRHTPGTMAWRGRSSLPPNAGSPASCPIFAESPTRISTPSGTLVHAAAKSWNCIIPLVLIGLRAFSQQKSPVSSTGLHAGGLGFEPRQTGSEPAVLPLHHPPVLGGSTNVSRIRRRIQYRPESPGSWINTASRLVPFPLKCIAFIMSPSWLF